MNNSFAAQHPELVCEWSERNLPLTPDRILPCMIWTVRGVLPTLPSGWAVLCGRAI